MRRLLSLMTVLAVALGVLSALAPAGAAARPTAPWISGQSVQPDGTVAVTLDWDPAAGAATYRVHWTASFDSPFTARDHQYTQPLTGTRAVIAHLQPGAIYCFALTADDGNGSERACKVTPPASRAVVPTALATTAAGNAYARWVKRPGALIRVPGIIMLVPGSIALRGVINLVQQQDLGAGQDAAIAALNTLMALLAGLLFGNLLISARRNL